MKVKVPQSLDDMAEKVHAIAEQHGFWPEEGRNFGEMLMLAVCELAESLEEHRAGRPNVWFKHEEGCPWHSTSPENAQRLHPHGCTCQHPKPEGVAVELVDNIIRSLDTLYSLDVDIDEVFWLKMQYNATRPYKHGKAY